MADDQEYLTSLEERILKAVELVGTLRKENAALSAKLEVAASETEAAHREESSAREQLATLRKEVDSLKSERKQVRTRIEKLLGQMDALSQS